MIAEPLLAPAVKGTEITVLLVRVTVPIVGAAGTFHVVIEPDDPDSAELPTLLVA